MAYEYETSILDQTLARRPASSALRFADWNEAVSTQARLNKAIKYYQKTYLSFPVHDRLYDQSPYKGLSLRIVRPSILMFEWNQANDAVPQLQPAATPEDILDLYTGTDRATREKEKDRLGLRKPPSDTVQ